ncbi:putative peptidoglycan lipid II flippase [Rhodoligotrophos appendicifer]|uniref:murein biosynthesis integral membrane protein MurJ n=1 Tax=Rhodoligotrophos appendicifer TaxID=987056 RepID=UPI001478621C|nr:murein biosynthesis integral membrane protein MurJ [Rhodoligotrophos appendicifer]
MNLLRSAMTVSGYTMASRVLGYVRDALSAGMLGTGPVAGAFVVAVRLPNMFRSLFAEGAFNSAFVPLFAKRLEGEGEGAARRFGEEVMSVMVVALTLFVVVAEIAMPLVMLVIAPGFAESDAQFDLAVTLSRIGFPYLMFMSLVAFFSGVLNSLGKFSFPAAAPIILNVMQIGTLATAAWLSWGAEARTAELLMWSIAISGLLQLIMLAWASYASGMNLRPRMPRLTPGVRRLFRLGIPGTIAAGITQINLVIGTMIASLIPHAPAWLYYADRVYQLPLGLIGVAMGIVLLPDLSRRLRAGDLVGMRHTQNRAIEMSMLLTLPSTIALVAMPVAIVHMLFEYGNFTAADTVATSQALAAFGLGLPAYVLIKIFTPTFFANEDTKTPMICAGVAVAVNITGSLASFSFIGHVGIALATTLSAWVNTLLLAGILVHRGQFETDDRLRSKLPRILVASLVMGAGLIAALVWPLAGIFVPGVSFLLQLGCFLALVIGGAVIFFGVGQLIRAFSFGEMKRMMRRPPASPPPEGLASPDI